MKNISAIKDESLEYLWSYAELIRQIDPAKSQEISDLAAIIHEDIIFLEVNPE